MELYFKEVLKSVTISNVNNPTGRREYTIMSLFDELLFYISIGLLRTSINIIILCIYFLILIYPISPTWREKLLVDWGYQLFEYSFLEVSLYLWNIILTVINTLIELRVKQWVLYNWNAARQKAELWLLNAILNFM